MAIGLLLAAGSAVGALWFFQERLIYLAPHYTAAELQHLPSGLVALRDPSNRESIVGFYRAPLEGGVPRKLWLTFGGNGDSALRWDGLISASVTRDVGFLMIEYPGYGARTGKPSPEGLLTGTEATVQALAQHLGTSVADLQARTSLLGYSIGSAAALQYAARHPAQRMILFSPFTSMLDMARRVVGSPLCNLLGHRYDNLAALKTIQAQGHPPINILHGADDSFIPPAMGKALAAAAPGSHFELVPGAEHGNVIDVAAPRLRELLAEASAVSNSAGIAPNSAEAVGGAGAAPSNAGAAPSNAGATPSGAEAAPSNAGAAPSGAVAGARIASIPAEALNAVVGCWQLDNREKWQIRRTESGGGQVTRTLLGAAASSSSPDYLARLANPSDLMFQPAESTFAFTTAGRIHATMALFIVREQTLEASWATSRTPDEKYQPVAGTLTLRRCVAPGP